MPPNALTKKLNVNAGRLFNEYGILYENSRSHDGRKVSFSVCRRDGRVDDLESGCGVKDTVIIDTHRHEKV